MFYRFIHIATNGRMSYFFYGWVLLYYICVTHLLHPFICWWTLGLTPYLGYSQAVLQWTLKCSIFSKQCFHFIFPRYTLRSRVVGSYGSSTSRFFFSLIFVYLAASSVSGGCRIFCCGTRASLYLCADSVGAIHGLNCPVSCGVLVPQPGIQPAFPVLEGAPPGKSLLLVFRGTSILFSMVVALTYIPTSSVQGFPFLHILANICYL